MVPERLWYRTTVLVGDIHSHVLASQLLSRSSVIIGALQAGGISICYNRLECSYEATLDSLHTLFDLTSRT
jgi:hypothetical protein